MIKSSYLLTFSEFDIACKEGHIVSLIVVVIPWTWIQILPFLSLCNFSADVQRMHAYYDDIEWQSFQPSMIPAHSFYCTVMLLGQNVFTVTI